MSGRELVRTWYRSLTSDGEVWCESRNPDEVRHMSKGKDCTFEVFHVYEVTDGWEPWDDVDAPLASKLGDRPAGE